MGMILLACFEPYPERAICRCDPPFSNNSASLPHFHLPLQADKGRLLERMRRRFCRFVIRHYARARRADR